jgi:hypothetical protein
VFVQVSSLVAEVAAKQEQLQALEAEHEALTAKARALDQLVASAGWCSGYAVALPRKPLCCNGVSARVLCTGIQGALYTISYRLGRFVLWQPGTPPLPRLSGMACAYR